MNNLVPGTLRLKATNAPLRAQYVSKPANNSKELITKTISKDHKEHKHDKKHKKHKKDKKDRKEKKSKNRDDQINTK